MQRFWKMNDRDSIRRVFQADLDGAQWDDEDLKERMELMMAKLDPERVIEFGDKVVKKPKRIRMMFSEALSVSSLRNEFRTTFGSITR